VRQGKPGETEGQRPSKEESEGKTGCETTHKCRCRGDGDRGKRQNERYVQMGRREIKKKRGDRKNAKRRREREMIVGGNSFALTLIRRLGAFMTQNFEQL
jgi:hypothetical protein